MQLKLKNIGMIKEADVSIDGLTVIAGENDTGKSTVGKLLFAIIKAVSRYKEDIEENREEKIFRYLEKIYFHLRRRIKFEDNIDLREMFVPPKFYRDIESEGEIAVEKRINRVRELQHDFLFERIENNLLWLEKQLIELISILKIKEDKKSIIKRAFTKVMFSEFGSELSNKKSRGKSTINIDEHDNLILSISMKNNDIEEFNMYDVAYYKDATFIETPIVLQMSELINHSKTYFDNEFTSRLSIPNIPLHIKDLNDKLKESMYGDKVLIDLLFNELPERLETIMNGKIVYDKKSREFLYHKSDGKKYKSMNVATGIKSFAILQLLVESGFLNDRTLLILDEPEVHLHPKWQLKYAEVIVELVNHGIDILVTSHSPYMIEALQRYSDKKDVKANFYLAENGNIYKEENSNSKTLSKIFSKLSEPFDIFEEMESERFQNGRN